MSMDGQVKWKTDQQLPFVRGLAMGPASAQQAAGPGAFFPDSKARKK